MSSGVVHYKYYMSGYKYSVPASLGSWYLFGWMFGLGYFLGYSFHRYCDNDWDLMGTSGSEGRMVNELPIIGHLLFGVSSTYGSIFRKYHRSAITHWPVVSTAIRLFFVFSVPVIILHGYGINALSSELMNMWVGILTGLSHADAIHLYLDIYPKKG